MKQNKREKRLCDYKCWTDAENENPELIERYRDELLLWDDLRGLVQEAENRLYEIQGGPQRLAEREGIVGIMRKTYDMKPFFSLIQGIANIVRTAEAISDEESEKVLTIYDFLGIPVLADIAKRMRGDESESAIS
jgi:hypothetical protein